MNDEFFELLREHAREERFLRRFAQWITALSRRDIRRPSILDRSPLAPTRQDNYDAIDWSR